MKPVLLFCKISTARVHKDNQISEEIPILRGVREGDPIFPQLFIATIQEVLKNAHLEEKAINIDGEKLSDPRFAGNVLNNRFRRERYGISIKHRVRGKLKDWSQDT